MSIESCIAPEESQATPHILAPFTEKQIQWRTIAKILFNDELPLEIEGSQYLNITKDAIGMQQEA